MPRVKPKFAAPYAYGVMHGIAECVVCGWRTGSYKNAQALAARHAQSTGHRVQGELGISFSYGNKTASETP